MANCAICGKPVTSGLAVHTECFPRWIPVTERLPEPEQKVLVAALSVARGKQTAGVGTYYDRIPKPGMPCGFWVTSAFGDLGEVTHWMPIPEPPTT